MLFAEIDSAGWVAIISAIFTGLAILATQVVTLILDYYREKAKIIRDTAAAREVLEVKTTLQDTQTAQGEKLDVLTKSNEALTKASEATHEAVNSTAKALADQKLKDDVEKSKLIAENAAIKARLGPGQ